MQRAVLSLLILYPEEIDERTTILSQPSDPAYAPLGPTFSPALPAVEASLSIFFFCVSTSYIIGVLSDPTSCMAS